MKLFSGLLILQALVFFQPGYSQNIQSPDKMFGFRMGSDRKLINWEQMLAYFFYLDKQSNRIRVVELGKTTLNRPMIINDISKPGEI